MEQWKDVTGYEGLYQVSDLGRVKRVNGRRSILTNVFDSSKGYFVVCLSKDGITKVAKVHRLVGAAWLGSCPDGCETLHGSAGKRDNSVGNLSYGSRSQNQLDRRRDGHGQAKRVVRSDGIEFNSLAEAIESTGRPRSGVWECCNGKQKTAGGYGWQYL